MYNVGVLADIYNKLFECYGPQFWWPGETPFEIMAGAILTQATSWENAAKAITNLKNAGALEPKALYEMPANELAELIRPSGYYNAKARKLKSFLQWLYSICHFNLDLLNEFETSKLRQSLLAVYGIGEETADSILLYTLKRPVFVIDAYTRRIIERIGLTPGKASKYNDYQRLFMTNLAPDTALYNEYHALLVKHAKISCRQKPLCKNCCVRNICILYNDYTQVE